MSRRCNICGSIKNPLGYASTLDGMVCEQCKKMYFRDTAVGVEPVLYNKTDTIDALNKLGNAGYKTALKALKDLQSRYCYFIDRSDIHFDYRSQPNIEVILYLKLRYRNRCIEGKLVSNQNKSFYILKNGDKTIYKEFNAYR